MKQRLKKEIKFATRISFGAIIFITVAGTGIWALAAFTEPTTTPGNSVQDFAKNIMGANNSDNAFDSGDVTGNSDGSIVERLEALENKGVVTALSAVSSSMTYAQATTYCRNLSATAEYVSDGSNTGITYTDWHLGTLSEVSIFIGVTTDTHPLWTPMPYESYSNYQWVTVRLSSGTWSKSLPTASAYIRCVR